MAGCELAFRANVDQVIDALSFELTRQLRSRDPCDRFFLRYAECQCPCRFKTAGRCRGRGPLRFFVQIETGEHPAHGSISQRPDVGHAEAPQRRGANYTARATRAIDDDFCLLALLQFFGPENQVTARDVDTAGNAKPAVFLRSANIENDKIRRTLLKRLKFFRSQIRNVPFMANSLAESFAWDIDAAHCGPSFVLPCA